MKNNRELLKRIRAIVGPKNVLTKPSKTLFYRKGFRFGEGIAVAVVTPGTILEQWLVIKECVKSNCAIILQAANTGLTGGSSPTREGYDRDLVVINTLRINSIHLIKQGKQAISLSGATLHNLTHKLKKVGREPHSVIGSSQIGATVVGGIANNSGGALVKRGPAYTEFSLYAQVDKNGDLHLVNHLGIEGLGSTPEEVLINIQDGNIDPRRILDEEGMASDSEYIDWVRDVGSNIPARFNADSRRLFEASGCAGKLAVFAVRTDTFPCQKGKQVFYIGTNSSENLAQLRKDILTNFKCLPDMAEYLNREIFDITEKYGKYIFLAVKLFGEGNMSMFFKIKTKIEYLVNKIPGLSTNTLNNVLIHLTNLSPKHLPKRMIEYRNKYKHHLIISASDSGIGEMQKYLSTKWSAYSENGFFSCTYNEGESALLHRFSAGGAIGNYQAMYRSKVGEILALDIALRRNDNDWVDSLPEDVSKHVLFPLCYGHFLCNVFHRNYLLKKGSDKEDIKEKLLALLDKKGAKYPAEHNVGHLYKADKSLQDFYVKLDPTNTFNPGVGKTSKHRMHCNCCI